MSAVLHRRVPHPVAQLGAGHGPARRALRSRVLRPSVPHFPFPVPNPASLRRSVASSLFYLTLLLHPSPPNFAKSRHTPIPLTLASMPKTMRAIWQPGQSRIALAPRALRPSALPSSPFVASWLRPFPCQLPSPPQPAIIPQFPLASSEPGLCGRGEPAGTEPIRGRAGDATNADHRFLADSRL